MMSDAIKLGNLSDKDVATYQRIFREKFLSKTMLNEIRDIRDNARKINQAEVVKVPTLLFSSNGKGTGLTSQKWLEFQAAFAEKQVRSKLVILACPHYVHHHQVEKISSDISSWLANN